VSVPSPNKKYLGKYRGTVMQNIDPELRGRLQLEIADVLGLVPSTWAEPCLPLSGPTGPAMGVYMVPPIGAGVWVEFEQGDPGKPIWVGCRFDNTASVPPLAQASLPGSPNIVLQTLGQNKVVLTDVPAMGVMIQTATGASLIVSDVGIMLSNGKGASIALVGNSVAINAGALTVT
jgi:hypothetical protein